MNAVVLTLILNVRVSQPQKGGDEYALGKKEKVCAIRAQMQDSLS